MNTVSLNTLLQKLDAHIPVGKVVKVIGDRESFTEEEANKIVSELEWNFSKDSISPTVVIDSIVKEYVGEWRGIVEIPLNEYLPEKLHGMNLRYCIDRRGILLTYIVSPSVGKAFVPTRDDVFMEIESSEKCGALHQAIIDQLNELNGVTAPDLPEPVEHKPLLTLVLERFARMRQMLPKNWNEPIDINLEGFDTPFSRGDVLNITFSGGTHQHGKHTFNVQNVHVGISNASVGKAFWPTVETINMLDSEKQRALLYGVESIITLKLEQAGLLNHVRRRIERSATWPAILGDLKD
jgi:hypothetical protein